MKNAIKKLGKNWVIMLSVPKHCIYFIILPFPYRHCNIAKEILFFDRAGKKNVLRSCEGNFGSLVMWFSWKFWSQMDFASLLDQFVGSLFWSCWWAFKIQIWFINFSAKILIDGVTVILSLISENSRSRFMLELMLLLCRFWILIRFQVARYLRFFLVCWWFRQYCSSSVISSEDQICKNTGYNRMFRAIDLAVLSGLGRS